MMCLLVYAHAYCGMPRLVSLVIGLALDRSSRGPTHTFITPLTGARYEIDDPSGEILACALSGLPKSRAREINSTPLLMLIGARSGLTNTEGGGALGAGATLPG